MPKFKIHYTFDGRGTCEIEAKNKQEAEDLFIDNDHYYDNMEEIGNNEEFSHAEEMPK